MSELEQEIEKIGRLVDRVDSLIASLSIPMPVNLHIQALKDILPEIKDELRDVYFDLGGDEDTW